MLRAVKLLHQASSSNRAGAGSSERTSPAQDTTRVSHSQGHARSHQLQPDIITEPLGSLTVILLVIPPAVTQRVRTELNSASVCQAAAGWCRRWSARMRR
jgi:hypothetical protein